MKEVLYSFQVRSSQSAHSNICIATPVSESTTTLMSRSFSEQRLQCFSARSGIVAIFWAANSCMASPARRLPLTISFEEVKVTGLSGVLREMMIPRSGHNWLMRRCPILLPSIVLV